MNDHWVRRLTVASVLLVAVVAGIISFAHLFELTTRHGEVWRASIFPLSVDGMLIAATLAIVNTRRRREPAGWVPWLGLTLGIAASLGGNIAAARPDLISQIIAAWPPVALAVSIETMVVVLRRPIEQPTEPVTATAELVNEPDLIAELLEQGVGRRRLSRELGITEHEARQLLASQNGSAS